MARCSSCPETYFYYENGRANEMENEMDSAIRTGRSLTEIDFCSY
jgi:hypothetical protein